MKKRNRLDEGDSSDAVLPNGYLPKGRRLPWFVLLSFCLLSVMNFVNFGMAISCKTNWEEQVGRNEMILQSFSEPFLNIG
ncbi:hypothetical protein IIC38_19850 [candidate division KSB1 bacterium]|nr:hypothetical protein [candidate division KSB1 bacterium]